MSEAAVHDPGPEGRERLIESAVRLFGKNGFEGTSVRDIADDAGVSFSLIRFYFGSKDGLRDAAEAWVVTYCLDRTLSAADAERFEDVAPHIEALLDSSLAPTDVIPFLRRAFIDERPIALELVKGLIAKAGTFRGKRAPGEAWAQDPTLLVAQGVGLMMLSPIFQTLQGRDVYGREELLRLNAQAFRMEELILKGLAAEAEERERRGA
ncbi:MAG TPA: TetR family transcriptional regulator [Caulobacteraceae bacterium]|jgi:AcrR family transcriptional regulator|nr:TetR family transcriptional regulator [Caulobacteraceae bacterium]